MTSEREGPPVDGPAEVHPEPRAETSGPAPETSEPAPEITEPAAAVTVPEAVVAETEPIPAVPEPAPAAAAGTAPAVVAAGQPTEPEAITTSSRAVRRRDQALGTTGQIAAVIGIVVSFALIVVVLLGRGWLVGRTDELAGTIDGGLAKGVTLVDTASARISEVSGRVGAVADAANAIAANPNPAPALSEALSAQLQPIQDRYLALRSAYTDVRTTVVSALDRLQTLDRLLPFISIPQGPVDALTTLDARVQAIDAKVTDLLATPGSGAVNAVAQGIATKATDLQGRLQSVTATLDDVGTRITTLQSNVQAKADQIKLLVTLVSLVLILGLLYSAFLHWVLFRASGGRRRKTDAA